MKRKVLFNKKEDTPLKPKAEKKTVVPALIEKKTISGTHISVLDWLKNHKLIKARTLCLEAGLDPGSFHRWVNVNKELPPHAIEKLTPILKEYGYEADV